MAAPLPLDEIVDDIRTRMTRAAFEKLCSNEVFTHGFAVIITRDQKTGEMLRSQGDQIVPYMVSYMFPAFIGKGVEIERAKESTAEMVRTIAIAGEAVACVMVMDTWIVQDPTPADLAIRPSANPRRRDALVTIVERADLRTQETTIAPYDKVGSAVIQGEPRTMTQPFRTMEEDIADQRFATLPRSPQTTDQISAARALLREALSKGGPLRARRGAS